MTEVRLAARSLQEDPSDDIRPVLRPRPRPVRPGPVRPRRTRRRCGRGLRAPRPSLDPKRGGLEPARRVGGLPHRAGDRGPGPGLPEGHGHDRAAVPQRADGASPRRAAAGHALRRPEGDPPRDFRDLQGHPGAGHRHGTQHLVLPELVGPRRPRRTGLHLGRRGRQPAGGRRGPVRLPLPAPGPAPRFIWRCATRSPDRPSPPR